MQQQIDAVWQSLAKLGKAQTGQMLVIGQGMACMWDVGWTRGLGGQRQIGMAQGQLGSWAKAMGNGLHDTMISLQVGRVDCHSLLFKEWRKGVRRRSQHIHQT